MWTSKLPPKHHSVDKTGMKEIMSYQYTSDVKNKLHIAVLDTGINDNDEVFNGFEICQYKVVDEETDPEAVRKENIHGTNVAGILCTMLYGIKDRVKISVIKTTKNEENLEFSNLKAAYDLLEVEPKLKDVTLINQSIGLFKTPDEKYELEDKITDIKALICAASNEGKWDLNTIAWPAKKAVAVGSHDENAQRSGFSPQGPGLWVLAPGEYGDFNGTSFAAPWVTALLAHFLLQLPHRYPGNIGFLSSFYLLACIFLQYCFIISPTPKETKLYF